MVNIQNIQINDFYIPSSEQKSEGKKNIENNSNELFLSR